MTTDATDDPETVEAAEPRGVLGAGPAIEERETRLREGADRIRRTRSSILSDPRVLVVAAATLMTMGISAVLLGWIGASHSTLVEEQVPYLISGGLLGVALSMIGALLFFTHWLTVGIKEARNHEAARREDHEELVEVLRALGRPPVRGEVVDGDARSDRTGRPVRRAPRGS